MLSNIFAFILPLLLAFYWGVVGYAALALCYTQRSTTRNLLLAPALGLAITMVWVFLGSWYGFPVKSFAVTLSLLLFFVSLAILFWRKPITSFRRYWPFLLLLIIGLLVVGYPLLKYGFNWIAFANDDMSNYVLGALRFLNHPYRSNLNVHSLVQGTDYSTIYWYLNVASLSRSGNFLLLAWLSALTKLNPLSLFMPLIMAMQVAAWGALAALVYKGKNSLKIALWALTLFIFSALSALGLYYQLIAQASGVCIMLLLINLLFQLEFRGSVARTVRHALLGAVAGASICMLYPEISGFVALGYIFYIVINVLKGWRPDKRFFLFILIVLVVLFAILGRYSINYFLYVLLQAKGGIHSHHFSLFPYFLTPMGLFYFFGILPIPSAPPMGTYFLIFLTGIWLISFALFVFFIYQAVKQYWFKRTFASVSIVMLIMLGVLFHTHSGFGLFKLAMYIQAFIAVILTAGVYETFKNRYFMRLSIPILILLPLLILNCFSLLNYRNASEGALGGFAQIPYGSKGGLSSELSELSKAGASNTTHLYIASSNLVIQKLALAYTTNKPTFILGRQFLLHNFPKGNTAGSIGPLYPKLEPKVYKQTITTRKSIQGLLKKESFLIGHNKKGREIQTSFEQLNKKPAKKGLYLLNTQKLDIINRWHPFARQNKNVVLMPDNQLQNTLVFTQSSLGENYYFGAGPRIGLFQTQADHYYPHSSGYSGLGQYLLFEVIHPTKNPRMLISVSSTLTPDHQQKIPPITVIGQGVYHFNILGMGSGRIVSVPITPRKINGRYYILLNMGRAGKHYPNRRRGLFNFYGKSVKSDDRHLAAFGRDISLISTKQYNAITPPTQVAHFPKGLANRDLLYSGCYEDGWLSPNSWWNLSKPANSHVLRIKGSIPISKDKDHRTQITVKDNRVVVYKGELLKAGVFDLEIPVKNHSKKQHVSIAFSKSLTLPKPDGRVAGARLSFIGFV